MNRITQLNEWLLKREPRERLVLFVGGFLIIYFIWYLFLMRPLLTKKEKFISEISAQELQRTTIDSQIKIKLVNIKDSLFANKLNQKNEVSAKIQDIQKQLGKLKPLLIRRNDMTDLSRDLLKQKSDSIYIVNIDKLPPVPWQPSEIEHSDYLNIVTSDIYLYAMSIEFQSDYFNTIDFIKKLEKLPWYIYWDSLDYKVLEYPKANVKLKFHVLSDEKS